MENDMEYKSCRFIDGKIAWVIVGEYGKIINKEPSKEQLKRLDRFHEKDGRCKSRPCGRYTEEELLEYLKQFYGEYGRPPVKTDFNNNPEYPGFKIYYTRFGSWSKALKLVGLDVESMVKKGILETADQKARFTEIIIKNHFKQNPVDLAGKNCRSPCDGICPNGMNYDVKSSKFRKEMKHWRFATYNKYKEEIEIYYLVGFNSDWTKLEYVWRIPGEIVEKDYFYVGLNIGRRFNIRNMKEYDITDKFKDIFKDMS